MRKALLLAVAVVACSKAETPATDSAAATTPPPPPQPAALTAADVRGTWNGTSKREGSDSSRTFVVVSSTDSTGKIVYAGSKDSVSTSTTFSGDSMIVTSASHKDPTLPKAVGNVVFRAVGRMKDGKLVGTASVMPAAKPDSVIGRTTWEATKAP
ncbi:MAG TPA: hypothetical protein VM076_21715 [Gemmatimonadaceae bacterium]|nr:hypothetical protein [Gemmatimonadaceae bacterium]